ncbi:MAG: heavy metal translocating P-type ATPase [Clostridia bacterium]|nr:heavy metal translocating P-type ATPase [Clostridia bacterium]
MEQYNVTGMSCAACSARVEKAVSKVPGVEACSVNLLTGTMGVEGSAPPSEIIRAVTDAGYGASIKDEKNTARPEGTASDNSEVSKLLKRLLSSAVILMVLMYFSMGHMMFGFPLPRFFDGNHIACALVQMILAAVIAVINQRFFISGFKGALHLSPNMDTLVALGSGISFIWSTAVLFRMTAAKDAGALASLSGQLYFESSAMILTLITIGKTLEAKSKGKTTDAIRGLMDLSPVTAVIKRGDGTVTVPVDEVIKGDVFIVKAGDAIPVDGRVISGNSAVNESALTGESIPSDKSPGDYVSAGTVNQSGYLECEAVRVGQDTLLSQIIKTVTEAAATKAPAAKLADKVSGVFVPAVILISVITLTVWLIIGRSFEFSLARAISVLVISCPCALGLATPVAIMVGNGVGAKNGILFKTASSLENTGKVNIAVLDKTGTVTRGIPQVTDIIPCGGAGEDELLQTAASVEIKSSHPLAKAIANEAESRGIKSVDIKEFREIPGKGLEAVSDAGKIRAGSFGYISEFTDISAENIKKINSLAADGKTPVLFSLDGLLLGIIALADTVKPDSSQAVEELKNMGLGVIMLTGDNEKTAAAIGRQAGVDGIIAGVLPDGKEEKIRELKKYGNVAMVGDGINDAPALTSADTGIAIGAGTDIAIDAADAVLMKNSLRDVAAAIRLSRATLRNIRQNLFWAFFYNVLCIPLAAGAFSSFGLTLSPAIGAAAMSLSSFFVVSNALRLNFTKLYDSGGYRGKTPPDLSDFIKNSNINKGEKNMIKTTVKIEGMMCPHCEARVTEALKNALGAENVTSSHEKAESVIIADKSFDEAFIKKTVEEAGYKFIEIVTEEI